MIFFNLYFNLSHFNLLSELFWKHGPGHNEFRWSSSLSKQKQKKSGWSSSLNPSDLSRHFCLSQYIFFQVTLPNISPYTLEYLPSPPILLEAAVLNRKMLWVDKYRPKTLDQVMVHQVIAQNLKKLVRSSISLLFYGFNLFPKLWTF